MKLYFTEITPPNQINAFEKEDNYYYELFPSEHDFCFDFSKPLNYLYVVLSDCKEKTKNTFEKEILPTFLLDNTSSLRKNGWYYCGDDSKLSYSEFLKLLKKNNIDYFSDKRYSNRESKSHYSYYFNSNVTFFKKDYLEEKWVTGGLSGGNYYGGKANDARIAEQEPEFNQLDKCIEIIDPNVSYLEYKKHFMNRDSSLIHYQEEHQDEYYGNYTNYTSKCIRLIDLYTWYKKAR